jgi:hypothetical protein
MLALRPFVFFTFSGVSNNTWKTVMCEFAAVDLRGNQLPLNGLCRIADTPLGGDAPMTIRTDHHSDFDPAQLVLYGAAAAVLLVYAWTFVL